MLENWCQMFENIYRLLGIKLAAITAYHPQGDGQTEWVNQELEQYLRVFINQRQDDWDGLLLLAEFQYNNHIHSATRQVPFLLDTVTLAEYPVWDLNQGNVSLT